MSSNPAPRFTSVAFHARMSATAKALPSGASMTACIDASGTDLGPNAIPEMASASPSDGSATSVMRALRKHLDAGSEHFRRKTRAP